MKVAIVGTAPSSRYLAPYHDKEWSIWGCSMANMNALPRVDEWFELHHLDLIDGGSERSKGFIGYLASQPKVWLSKADHRVPNGEVLDPAPLIEQFGSYFFSSTIAWMFAKAIHDKAERIGIYGVDMGNSAEYDAQRPGMHYFVREATRRGIEVQVPIESDLLEPPPLYGFCHHDPMWRKLDLHRSELHQRERIAERTSREREVEAAFLRGAREQAEKVLLTYTGKRQGIVLK